MPVGTFVMAGNEISGRICAVVVLDEGQFFYNVRYFDNGSVKECEFYEWELRPIKKKESLKCDSET